VPVARFCATQHQQGDVLPVAFEYAGASVDELKRLKEFEAENAKLTDVRR